LAQTNHVKVLVELNGLRHTVEGDSEQVIKEVIQFISRVCPPFDIASRIVWSPDYANMLETISRLAKISPSGEIIITELVPSSDQAIGLILLCAHIANKFGKRMNDEMSVEEISSASGKAIKTVRNTLVEMVKAGLVERTGRGTYKISTNGMKEVQEAANELSQNEMSKNTDS
jgi:DNA-binding transcriptional ArsR family regulator